MKGTSIFACLGILVLMLGLNVIPQGARATTYMPAYGADIIEPGANYSHGQYVYDTHWGAGIPYGGVHEDLLIGAQKLLDGELEGAYASSPTLLWMRTQDYGQPLWSWSGSDWFVHPLPPNNATIYWINGVAVFYITGVGEGNAPSNPHLRFSINGGSTYTNDSENLRIDTNIDGYYFIYWNITTMAAWTPALVKSSNLSVMLTWDGAASTQYMVDYIGITYLWYNPGTWFNPDASSSRWFGDIQMNGIISSMALVGLIITPAVAIWASKVGGHDRLTTIVYGTVTMAFFLALFLGVS